MTEIPAPRQDIRERLDQVRDLPALPEIMDRVVKALSDESVSLGELARDISYDQGMTGKILKVVNSAFYGFHRRIETLKDATVILGLKEISGLILSLSVNEFFKRQNAPGFNGPAFWEYSVRAAFAAQIVSEVTERRDPASFVTGLLHDLGKLVIVQNLSEDWPAIHRLIEDEEIRDVEAERRVLGADHGLIGWWVADHWQLPARMAEAIGFHHEPEKARNCRDLAAILNIAEAVARRSGTDYQPDQHEPTVHTAAVKRLALDAHVLETCERTLEERTERIESFLATTA